jgi:hypothetical protein
MSSNMTSIPESFIQYPVPGIDNDSQGFRDRYATIRSNLNTAKEEIGLLNQNSAKLNENNNFDGNKIIDADLTLTTFETNTANDGDPITENTPDPISWISGSVQVIRVGTSVPPSPSTPLTLSFTNWPTENRLAKITLIVNGDTGLAGSRTIAWPNNVKINFNIAESSITALSTKIFEVFTYDAGTTLFVSYVGEFE